MSVHSIHLKGPWEYAWLDPAPVAPGEERPASAPDEDRPEAGRAKMPASWQAVVGPRAGTIRWSRRFQRPTNLEADDRVWLAFAGIGGSARFLLDDVPLGAVQDETTVRLEITRSLARTNRLDVDVTFDPESHPGPGGLYGVVTIEIETPA